MGTDYRTIMIYQWEQLHMTNVGNLLTISQITMDPTGVHYYTITDSVFDVVEIVNYCEFISIFTGYLQILSGFGFVLNIILLNFILFRVAKNIGAYRYFQVLHLYIEMNALKYCSSWPTLASISILALSP